MKNNLIKFTITILILVTHGRLAWSQGFLNLDFENPILPLVPVNFQVSTASALPGWTAYLDGNSLSTIGYDTVSLGSAFVFLEDSNANSSGPPPIQGSYSVLLQGPQPGLQTSTAIGQTGTIPNIAQSLTFFGNIFGNLQVTFNGHTIPYSAVGNGANYTIYGADISSYAGQTGQLLFTTPVNTGALLDNIQFSPSAVPEPSPLALGALGALLFGCRRWRQFRQ